MTEETKPETVEHEDAVELTETDVEELVEGTADERDDAARRAALAQKAISEVLDKYRCRIIPRIPLETIEPVGVLGNKVQITATYWIAPLS